MRYNVVLNNPTLEKHHHHTPLSLAFHSRAPRMPHRHILLLSLACFALGVLCQIYSMFSEAEPFIQQLSFMLVTMPSAIAVINHYYHRIYASEESMASLATHVRDHVLNPPVHPPGGC
jgi:hypothetical protein